TELVSLGNGGYEPTGAQRNMDISADGRYVLFTSDDAVLTGTSHGIPGLFVRDRTAATTTRVDVSTAGDAGNDGTYQATISPNGRYVAFPSTSTNLDGTDQPLCQNGTRNCLDVFVHDRDPNGTGSFDQPGTT